MCKFLGRANLFARVLKDMDEFEQRGSGWTPHSIVNLAINANKHNPMRGSSYIELPDSIKNQGASALVYWISPLIESDTSATSGCSP